MGKREMMEEGFIRLEEGISKAKLILDGHLANALFRPEDYMYYYDCVYTMCIKQPSNEHSSQLQERFRSALQEAIISKILPSLMDKDGVPLLLELLRLWTNYKAMTKCLSVFFLYLERQYSFCASAVSLSDVSVCCFDDLVCKAFYKRIIDAAIFLITQDRSGVPINWNLLLSVKSLFMDVGELAEVSYYDKFVEAIHEDTATYYCQMASQWINCFSANDYLIKVQWCWREEKGRAGQLMSDMSVKRLLEVLYFQLIHQNAQKLTEKIKAEKHESSAYQDILSGCASLRIG